MRVNLAAELRSEARRGNTASVTRLVLRGANVHDVDEFGLTAMMWAARYGHTDTVTTLIERHGARVEAIDGFGWTALMLATMHGHIDTTTTLIERHGANVEAEDKYGSTPLMKAAKDGHGELVSRLIARHNANVDAADNYGWTPLIWASKHGNAMVVTRLIEMHRANVEAADKEGMTVLIWAAGNGHTETVRTLVERHGASMDRRARNGTRALQFALEKGHQSTAAEISRLQDRQVQTVETAAPMLTSDTTSLRSVGSISASDASRPDFDQLTLGLLLGEGSFGRVHLGSWMETDVAVKVLDRSSFSSLSRERRETTNDLRVLLEESDMMAGLRHPNIVQFIGVSLEGPRPCIITEYCARGSLCDVLRQASSDPRGQTARALTWSRRLSMAQDAAKGMLYLHRLQPRAILHRDLKSPNMLVSSDWTVKISDFGLSKLSELAADNTSMSTLHGNNPRWLAPEVIRGEDAGRGSDVFSFGVVMWELLTWEIPWGRANPFTIATKVTQGIRPVTPPLHQLPGPDNDCFQAGLEDYLALMHRCWSDIPEDRPDFQEIIQALRDRIGTKIQPAS